MCEREREKSEKIESEIERREKIAGVCVCVENLRRKISRA